jgi:ankyrin repeat protein
MEEVCQRFPLIAQKILNHVDNETFINFKKVSRNNADFLKTERFYWIRIIQRYNCLFEELHEVWKKVVSKTPVVIVKELAIAVHQFPLTLSKKFQKNETQCVCDGAQCACNETILSPLDFTQNFERQWHPLFIGATSGSTNLCNHIVKKAGDVRDPRLLNPAFGLAKITPIVFAADLMGDVNVFEVLYETADDKNPVLLDTNWTLLHSLAAKGYFKMCTSMIEKVKDLSPHDNRGFTPYHIAALNGHVKVCHLLMDYLSDHNPMANCGRTPLHLAATYGRLEVCILLMKSAKACMDKNQMDNVLRIPLHMAAFNDHVEIVRLFMANLVDNVGQKLPLLDFNSAELLLINNRIPVEYRQTRKLYPTPLLNAIKGGSLNVCELLIEECKVDVNISDDFGMTPLHFASKLGHLEICKLLCKYVLNKNTVDNDRQTPYDLALSEHKWNIVSFLNNWSLLKFPQRFSETHKSLL